MPTREEVEAAVAQFQAELNSPALHDAILNPPLAPEVSDDEAEIEADERHNEACDERESEQQIADDQAVQEVRNYFEMG